MADETLAPTSPTPTSTPVAPKAEAPKVEPVQQQPNSSSSRSLTGEPDVLAGEPRAKEGDVGLAAPAAGIDIKFPDGFEVDQNVVGQFKTVAQEIGLDSPKSQKVIDLYVRMQEEAYKASDAAWNDQRQKWHEAASKDAEFGGAKFKENAALANKAIEKFGGPALRQALVELGVASHPEIVRFAFRVGKLISEDSALTPAAGAGVVSDEEATLRAAYPSMYKQDSSPT